MDLDERTFTVLMSQADCEGLIRELIGARMVADISDKTQTVLVAGVGRVGTVQIAMMVKAS